MSARLILVVTMLISVATTAVAAGSAIDETALRYYASLKQTTRVEAETRRLKRLDPKWQPPVDLWATRPAGADEGPLWALFAADRFDELHRSIDARRAKEPSWLPSTDLAQKLLQKEMQAKVISGKRAGRWDDVAAAAEQGRLADDINNVEMQWDIAEAYARTRRSSDALRVLTAILSRRTDPKERIATIQKAIALLPIADTERLVAMGARDAAGASEFVAIATDITRARLVAYLHDERSSIVPPSEMAQFMDYARAAEDANQAGLVAWAGLKRGDLREALDWFKISIARGGEATIAHGLAHTLKKMGQLREAEEVAYAWREPSAANTILFVDILADQLTQPMPAPLDAKRLARFAAVTMQTSSGEGAQALGWYAYNSCQFDVASDWFRRALAWLPKETTAFGYALTLQRLKRHQEFVEVVNRYDGLFPKVLTLLFPEINRSPPGPCDGTVKKDAAPEKSNAFLDLRAAGGGENRLLGTASRLGPALVSPRSARIEIPKPLLAAQVDVNDAVPLVKRTEFPIAVNPENPLRFAASDRKTVSQTASGEWRARDALPAAITARRVAGVVAMPYERFGFTLLQGWNGNTQPSLQPLETQAANGTAWHGEQIALAASQPASREASTAIAPTVSSRFHP